MPKVNHHRRAGAYLRPTLPLLDLLCHHCHLLLDKNNFLHTLIPTRRLCTPTETLLFWSGNTSPVNHSGWWLISSFHPVCVKYHLWRRPHGLFIWHAPLPPPAQRRTRWGARRRSDLSVWTASVLALWFVFLFGEGSSPAAAALPLFLCAPAVFHHFKWHGVFN